MNDKTQAQLVRQLKILNFWISLYGTLILVVLGIIIFMIFQMVTFVQKTNDKLGEVKEAASSAVDIKKQACKDTSPISSLLKKNTEYCD